MSTVWRCWTLVGAAMMMLFSSTQPIEASTTTREFTLVVHPQDVDTVNRDTGEAVTRLGFLVNGTYPGPTLTVNLGDQVVVKVVNQHPSTETVIHFHGQHQMGTFFMDGVAGVTQCAIAPQSSFEYRFTAEPAGTFFYHSHMPYQMADGVFGAFIVHDPFYASGHPDNPVEQEVVVGLSDWMRYDSDTIYQYASQLRMDIWPLKHYISYINGQQDFSFTMSPGSTYRLRIYCATVEFGYRLFMTGGHRMTVIAADGGLVRPTLTDYLDIYSGERYDVLVTADQDVGSYLLVANVLSFSGKLKKEVIHGSFIYEGYTSDATQAVADQLEAFDNADPSLMLLDQHSLTAYKDEATGEFSTGYTTLPGPWEVIADPWVYATTSYAVVNERQFKFMDAWDNHFNQRITRETTPLLFLGDNNNMEKYAREESREILVAAFSDSSVTHSAMLGPRLQFLELGETIDIVFQNAPTPGNELSHFNAFHPMHIHGHSFWPLASGEGVFDANVAAASANFVDPPLRDNVVVPPNSWVLVRLQASNPGLWLMHCHTETHAAFGMMTTLVVGDVSDRPTPPADFPVCGRGPALATPNGQLRRRNFPSRSGTITFLVGSALLGALVAGVVLVLARQRRGSSLVPYRRVQTPNQRPCGSGRRTRRDS